MFNLWPRYSTALITLNIIGCVEYELGGKTDATTPLTDTAEPDPPGPVGDIDVSPNAISEVGVCGDIERSIQITNNGDGDLNLIGITVSGTGWTASLPTLPLVLAPLDSIEFPLTGTTGAGEVIIQSDDPDEPFTVIPLDAVPDQPPTVAIVSPSDAAILSIGVPITLEAMVDDPEDGPSALALAWTSSLDGPLSTDPADPTGLASVPWSAASRSDGSQVVGLTATDSCGQTTEDAISVCQQAGYTEDELVIEDWHFEGVANWDSTNDWLELTSVTGDVVGSAFETGHTVSGESVAIQFLFFIGDGTGADGISLTALDTDRYDGVYLGGTGCGIGFGGMAGCTAGPALPGWSIEVDTYYNEDVDPTSEDHLAFYFDGNLSSLAAWAVLPEMEDTGWHEMSVVVTAPHISISIDGVPYIDTDLDGHFAFPAWVGFTAGTGGATNQHLIDSLKVTEYACDD